MSMCDHFFVKVIEVPTGCEDMDGYRIPPCCVRMQCVNCGAFEDELEDDL